MNTIRRIFVNVFLNTLLACSVIAQTGASDAHNSMPTTETTDTQISPTKDKDESEVLRDELRAALAKKDYIFLNNLVAKFAGLAMTPIATTDPQIRKIRMTVYLEVTQMVESARDLKFDSKELPLLHVAPPYIPGQATFSGMSPEDIKDPVARKAYEQAITDNLLKTERTVFQACLKSARGDLPIYATRFCSKNYSPSPDDLAEIQSILVTQISDVPLRAELKRQLIGKEKD